MGIFSIFRKKKDEPLPVLPTRELTPELVASDNMKAKMDLVLAQIDSLKTQFDALNQRTQTIETMVRELYNMAKS